VKIPYDYQLSALTAMRKRGIRRLPLFWQMRLGKSPLTIWWLHSQTPRPKKVLIICPLSVVVSWKEELDSFNIEYLNFQSKNKALHEKFAEVPCWVLTNYECLQASPVITEMPWDAIILDECTRIKNHRTKISKLCTSKKSFPLSTPKYNWQSPLQLAGKSQLRAVLAGKPAPETLLEYFPSFQFLDPKKGMMHYTSPWSFRKNLFYCDSGKYFPLPGTIKKVAKFLDDNTFELTRKKIGKEIPNIYEKRFVQLPPSYRKMYDDFEEHWYTDFLDTLMKEGLKGGSLKQIETKFAIVAQNYLHQFACGHPKNIELPTSNHKLNELENLITGELRGEKVVIWCRYLRDIEVIEKRIQKLYNNNKVDGFARVIKGGLKQEHLEKSLKDFRKTKHTDYKADYLICQSRKACMGMDFSVADTQIFYSRSFSSLENEQAPDRLKHPDKMGQKDASILTLDIITEDTIDEDLHHLLIEKKANSSLYKFFTQRTGRTISTDLMDLAGKRANALQKI
jgi:SNF2 family DNA or RNA helicase